MFIVGIASIASVVFGCSECSGATPDRRAFAHRAGCDGHRVHDGDRRSGHVRRTRECGDCVHCSDGDIGRLLGAGGVIGH